MTYTEKSLHMSISAPEGVLDPQMGQTEGTLMNLETSFDPLDPWAAKAESFDRTTNRTIRDAGHSQTDGGQAIVRQFFSETVEAVREALKDTEEDLNTSRLANYRPLLALMRSMDPEILALVALSGGIDAVANELRMTTMCIRIGRMLYDELWAQGLYEKDAKLARRLDEVARKRNASLKARKAAIRSMAQKEGYKPSSWTEKELCHAGAFLVDILAQTSAFELLAIENEYAKPETVLVMTDYARDFGADFVDQLLEAYPIHQPSLERPEPWTGPTKNLTFEGRSYRVNLVRKRDKVTQSTVARAIAEGRMDGVLKALNTIEAVEWTINDDVLDIVDWAYHADLKWKDAKGQTRRIGGLPPLSDLPAPARKKEWEEMNEDERKAWKIEAAAVAQANRGFIGQRRTMDKDLKTAHALTGRGFHTACSLDYRGRIYYLPQFNFQRQDYVRAMFKFAKGAPLGERGLYWLKIHLANCGDYSKISKAPFADRVKWVDDHHDILIDMADDLTTSAEWWSQADSPFMFVAAVLEYAAAYESGNPYTYVCSLPVSWDGSCSGLQHLALMTQCEKTAPLVNVVPTTKPADIYQTVYDRALPYFRLDAEKGQGETRLLGQKVLDHNGGRSLVKRNVMVYSYGSERFGMADQHMEDLMKPLALKVMQGELTVHPFQVPSDTFVTDDGKTVTRVGHTASKYLAGHIYKTITEVVEKPAEAMEYLQKIARALAHEGKPVVWTTPLGFPVVLRCLDVKSHRVRLHLTDRGVKSILKVSVDEEGTKINKAKAVNTIAPGFVHSYDACHLQMVANESASQGIDTLAFVHDSFGCLPSQCDEFREIIATTLHKLYSEQDVLARILEEAREQIDDPKRLPDPFVKGSLDISQVLSAAYAFA